MHYDPIVQIFHAHNIDAAAFVWAHTVLMSRMICFSLQDGTTLHVVGPGVDMFNHSIDAPVGNEDVRLEPPARCRSRQESDSRHRHSRSQFYPKWQ
eukprot:6190267-Prymnesium_polylepis.1